MPSLWRLEVANVLHNAVQRRRCSLMFADEALQNLEAISITIDAETDIHAWGPTLAISRSGNLTLYDAAYLELAIRLGATLVSCDRQLVAAARRRGVDVLTV